MLVVAFVEYSFKILQFSVWVFEESCNFFWHGSQHGAATCRLFSACDTLVREFSLEGWVVEPSASR